jgi:hypothetical protein
MKIIPLVSEAHVVVGSCPARYWSVNVNFLRDPMVMRSRGSNKRDGISVKTSKMSNFAWRFL